MATVPKSDRSTKITLASASAGPFSLDFRLFDDDGLAVYVNNLPRTDYTLSSTYVDGFDDNAAITFDATLAINDVIIADSSLSPRRDLDFLNSGGLVSKLNIEFARIWSAISDQHRDNRRSARFFQSVSAVALLADRLLIVNSTADGLEMGPEAGDIAAAQANAAAAEAALDDFTDIYLGAKASAPTLDNDGDALIDGAMYFSTATNELKVYDLGGAAWVATGNYSHPNHSGDVTSVADGATTIVANAVSLAKMAQVATARFLGRTTAATGDVEALTAAQATALLNAATTALKGTVEKSTLTENQARTATDKFPSVTGVGEIVDARMFSSAEQTITAAGPLTIAHGRGAEPNFLQVLLVCKTAEGNHSVGDKVFVNAGSSQSASRGVSVIPDSTYLNIRYGSASNVFSIPDKTTGTIFSITPANWKAIFRAQL